MTKEGNYAAKRRYQRESQVLCPKCGGTGRILSDLVKAKATKGGNSSYLTSLLPGHMSMYQRGKRGGRPKDPTIPESLENPGSRESEGEVAPESTVVPGSREAAGGPDPPAASLL